MGQLTAGGLPVGNQAVQGIGQGGVGVFVVRHQQAVVGKLVHDRPPGEILLVGGEDGEDRTYKNA